MLYTGVFDIKEKNEIPGSCFVPDSYFCAWFVHDMTPARASRGSTVYVYVHCNTPDFEFCPILVYTKGNIP